MLIITDIIDGNRVVLLELDAFVGDFVVGDVAAGHGQAGPSAGFLQGEGIGAVTCGRSRPVVAAIVGGQTGDPQFFAEEAHPAGDGALAHPRRSQLFTAVAAAQDQPRRQQVAVELVFAQRLAGGIGQFVHLFLVHLGAEKVQRSRFQVKIGDGERSHFADAQPVVEEEAHHQPVAASLGGVGLVFERLGLLGSDLDRLGLLQSNALDGAFLIDAHLFAAAVALHRADQRVFLRGEGAHLGCQACIRLH